MQTKRIPKMQDTPWRRIKRIHFIGIGGAGMSGIAEVLMNLGYDVSGSDRYASATTDRLQTLGATVFIGHAVSHVDGVDVVVLSTAIPAENPEYLAAKSIGLPIVKRAEMLAEIMRFRYGIAVAGAHGKTTTTSLITSILAQAKRDPTFVIGGLLNSAGANAGLGTSDYFIAEADESDASFLHLNPLISVITNIDNDHLETYNGSFECLKNIFLEFIQRLPFYGLAIVCVDDPIVNELMPRMARPLLSYGFSPKAQLRAQNFQQHGMQSHFEYVAAGQKPVPIVLNLPGQHNVLNALAAIAVARELDIAVSDIQTALKEFAGIGRRVQVRGELALSAGSALLIDDYGHHPREVAATLTALKAAYANRRLVMVYQPHRYSRTEVLFSDFVRVLADVEHLVLLDIYAAGEAPRPGVDSATLCQHIQQRTGRKPVHITDDTQLAGTLQTILQPDDVLLLQGAGNIGRLAQQLAETGIPAHD